MKNGLAAIGRRLRGWGRLIVAAPLRLLQLVFRLPLLLWHGFNWLIRTVIGLPGRIWRGLKAAVRFVLELPGRFWRGLKAAVRFVVGLPAAVARRLAFELYRIRLRVREWRARFVSWWRTRVFPARTISPRAQGMALLATTAALAVLSLFGAQLRQLSGREPETVIVTPTPNHARVSPLTPSGAVLEPTSSLSRVPSAYMPASSLDGLVAFSLQRNDNTDIFVRRPNDDQLLRLTYHPAEDREPVWAPDGETLAFVSHRGSNWDIYRLDLVSGVLIRLTRDPQYDAHPSWSPDGAFVAFESYRSGNLDIYLMSADGREVHQLTADQSADFAPAWSPDGRHIAFVSYRDGSRDVFLYSLDAGTESALINLTQTPDRDEDAPTWSPDGSRLAFSVGRFGAETIYITTFDWSSKYLDEAQTQLFNPGSQPDWSPDGTSLIFEYQRAGQSHLIADSVAGWGAGSEVFRTEDQVQDPSWNTPLIDPEPLAQQRQIAPMAAASVYIEEILPTPESGPPYTIVSLKDVNGGDDREFLSDRVDGSFQALRRRVVEETGTDYLATLGDSFRAIMVEPPPGQSPRSWHKAGRAFDLNQGLYEREEPLVELVREDIGFRTYWRVFLRAARQDGTLGEPLHLAPWDLKARQEGGLAAREGGELSEKVPLGYYVDFTALASEYGWKRVPANNQWRRQWADANWWQFQKTQRLSWSDAMLELYRLDQIEAVFGPISEVGR
jgi:TolB protein